jgi:SAM-dependent methyltransferase
MCNTSMENMKNFIEKYLHNEKIKVIDIGSMDVELCGNYRQLFEGRNEKYIGIDLSEGLNVDVVLEDPYKLPYKNNSIDCVISGNTFEHIEYPWSMFEEIKRVLKKDGLVCIIAPSHGKEHKYPVDCYRYFPDGFRALAKYVDLEVLECFYDERGHWKDCILIARK